MLNKIQLQDALTSTPKQFAYDEFLKFGGLVHLNDIKAVLGGNDTVREYLLMIIRLGVGSRSKIFDAINGDNQDPVTKANNLNFANVFYNVAMTHAGVMIEDNIKTINDKLLTSAREGWNTDLPVSFGVDRLNGVLSNLEIVSGGDKSPLFDEHGNIIPTRENFEDEVKRPYLEEWFGIVNIDPEEVFESYNIFKDEVKKMFDNEELHEEITSIPTLSNVNTDPYRYIDQLEGQLEIVTKAKKDGLISPAFTGSGKAPIQYETLETNVQHVPIKMIGKVTHNYAIESIVISAHDVGGIYGVIIDENTNFEFEVRDNLIVSFRENSSDDFKPLLEYHEVYNELVLTLEDEVPTDPINFSMIKNEDKMEEVTLEWYLWNFNIMIENGKEVPTTLEEIYHMYANSFFSAKEQYVDKDGTLDPTSDIYGNVVNNYKDMVEEIKINIMEEVEVPEPIVLTPITLTGLGDHLEDLTRFFSTEPKHYEAYVTRRMIIGSMQTVVNKAFLQPINNKKINGYVLDSDTNTLFIVVNGLIVWCENTDRDNVLPLLSWGDDIYDYEHRRNLPYGKNPITKFSEELAKDVVPEWLMINYQLVNKELSFDIEMEEHQYVVNTSSFEPLVKVDKEKALESNKILNTLQVALENNMLDNDSLKELGIEAPSDLTPMKGEESLEKEPTPPIIEEEVNTPEVETIESKEDEMSIEELNKTIEKSEMQMLEDVEAVENGNVTIGKIALMLIANSRTMNVVLSEVADIKGEITSIKNHIKDNNRGLASALELLQGIDENIIAPAKENAKGENALSINLNTIDQKLESLIKEVNSITTVPTTKTKVNEKKPLTKVDKTVVLTSEDVEIEKFDENVENSIEFQHPIVNGDEYDSCFGEIMEDTFSKSLNDNLGSEDVCQDGYIEGSDEAVICREDGRIVVSRLFDNKGESVTGRIKDSVTGKLFDFKNGYIMKVECPYEGKRGMIPIAHAKDYYDYKGDDSIMTTFDIAKGEAITGTFTEWLYELSTEGNDVTKGFANGMYQDLFYSKEKPKLTVVGEDKKTMAVDTVTETVKEVETPKEEIIPSKIKFYDGTQLIGLATDNSGDLLLSSQVPGEEAVYMIPSMNLNGQIYTPTAIANMLGVSSRELLPIFGKEYEHECTNWNGGVITSREGITNFDLMIPWAEVKASLGLIKQAQIKQDANIQQTAQVVDAFANNVVNAEYYREISLENTQAYSIPLSVTNDVVAFDDHDSRSLSRHLLENKATNLQTYNTIVGYLVITASMCTTNSSLMTDKSSPEYRAMISYAHAVGDVLRSLGEGNEEITRMATMYTIMYPNTGSLIITE